MADGSAMPGEPADQAAVRWSQPGLDLAAVAQEEGLVDRRLGRVLGLAGRRGELPHERRDVLLQLVVNPLFDHRDAKRSPSWRRI